MNADRLLLVLTFYIIFVKSSADTETGHADEYHTFRPILILGKDAKIEYEDNSNEEIQMLKLSTRKPPKTKKPRLKKALDGSSIEEENGQHEISAAEGSFEDSPLNVKSNVMDEAERKQYKAELEAGDKTRLFGPNQHRYQPEHFRLYDLGRRFVPQYPYKEVNQHNHIQEDEDPSLIPKRAPPELVLAVAKEAAMNQAAYPVDPNENFLKKESLRSGDYWNAYWKEDVEDPTNALRSSKRSKLDTVAAKLLPGSPLYEHVSKLNKLYPKLLYVINKTQ